jgi:hypothetical protein
VGGSCRSCGLCCQGCRVRSRRRFSRQRKDGLKGGRHLAGAVAQHEETVAPPAESVRWGLIGFKMGFNEV